MSLQVFIGYSHSDLEFERVGYKVWFDRTDIQTGTRWDDEIIKGLDAGDVLIP